jgi:uncharacterized protein (TIGR03083 family)
MDVAQYVDHLEHAGDQLLRAARFAGLGARVPSCPEWDVGQLVRHTTRVHHWALFVLGGGEHDAYAFERPADSELFAVFDAGLTQLVGALRTAPHDLDVWTYLPGETAVASWARRQAHETAVHRVDAELAADAGVGELEADFAADGIAELLLLMAPSRFSTADITEPLSITLTPIDANRAWTVYLSPTDVRVVELAQDGSDLNVFAPASDLYRWAWNRAGDDEVSLSGDVTLADVWHRNCRINARKS